MTIADNRTRWLALIVLCLGDLMIVLDVTIVGVALPSIREDLGFSEESLAWIVNAYLLTFGGFLLLGGRLGDIVGHRRMFLAGIALFTLASIGCGLADTQGLLIAARAVQGIGGAIVSAVALSLIITLFTEPAERAKAMGVFGFVASGGGSIGVLLGGVLTDTLDWHWIFLVNVPVGIAVFALTLVLLPAGGGMAARTARRRRCGDGDRRLHGRRLRDRERERGRLGHRANAGPARRRGRAPGGVPPDRVAGELSARPAPPLPAAEPRDRERRGHALVGGDVRLVLPLGALPAARARLQPARGGSRVPARQPDHGRPLARCLGEARDALRDPPAPRCGPRDGRGRPRCCSPGRRSTARSSSTCCPAWSCSASAPASPSTPCCSPR